MNYLKKGFFLLAVIFLVAFPKGGFKVADIPITWGYVILFLSVPFILPTIFDHGKAYFSKERRLTLGLCLPFIVYSIFILLLGTHESVGFLISFILNILIMPILFMFIFGKLIDSRNFESLFKKVFIACVRFIIIFGLFIFVQRILTGNGLEIPYLTVNIDDFGHIDEKFNLRGNIMKFTSTYNNGNIFGVCMLLLAPLYTQIEKYKVYKILFFISIALTLSRTSWIGIILFFMLLFKKNLTTIKGWSILILSIASLVIVTPILLSLLDLDMSFLFDKNLGGRSGQLNVFDNFTFFGSGHYDVIAEIVYASVLQTFGFVGLLLFLVYMFSALIVCLIYKKRKVNLTYDHWGLILYPILCISDGAMLFIPTMVFFWFLSSYVLRRQFDVTNTVQVN